MNLKDSINILAQTENGSFTETGIHNTSRHVVGVEQKLGLIILTQGNSQDFNQPAYKSVEIMLDDMELNLSAKIKSSQLSGFAASQCMSESLENINEYLCSQSANSETVDETNGVELAAIQIHQSSISYCSVGKVNCLVFNDNLGLQVLAVDNSAQEKLGIETSLQAEVAEHDVVVGDIVVLLPSDLLNLLTPDFIRITLSRFNQNLEMALRQINTRALQNDLPEKPTIALCRVNQMTEKKRSWFGKIRK